MVQPLCNSVWMFLRKLGMTLPEDPVIQLLGIYTEDFPEYSEDTCSSIFIAVLFIIARNWRDPDVLQWRNGYRKFGIFTQWNTNQQFKTMNS